MERNEEEVVELGKFFVGGVNLGFLELGFGGEGEEA